jgi:hypothetical protein
MTPLRLISIFVIFVVAAGAWFVLGGSVAFRTETSNERGFEDVGYLWGGPQAQTAPTFVSGGAAHDIASSDITADIALDQRKKGLLWYSTYAVDFDAVYGLASGGDEAERVDMTFAFPAADGVYDGFAVTVDGAEVPVRYGDGTAHAEIGRRP